MKKAYFNSKPTIQLKKVPIKKMKIRKIDSFYIPDTKANQESDKYLNSMVFNTRLNLLNLYLKDLPVIDVSNSFECNTTFSYLTNLGELGKLCHHLKSNLRVLKESNNLKTDLTFKAVYKRDLEDTVYYIAITEIANGSIDILVAGFSQSTKLAIILLLNIDKFNEDGDNNIVSSVSVVHGTPMYMSQKDRYVEQHLHQEFPDPLQPDTVDGMTEIELVDHVISIYLKETDNGKNKLPSVPFDHSNFEVCMFNKLYQSTSNTSSMINIQTWQSNRNQCDLAFLMNLRKEKPHYIITDPHMDCPVVDFSDKEMRFIRKYADESTLFADREKAKNIIDMKHVLMSPRYGKEMMIVVPDFEGKQYILNFTYDYNNESDECKLIVRTDINENVVTFLQFIFIDIANFRFSKSVARFESTLYYRNNVELPHTSDEVKKLVPKFMYDRDMVLNLAADIMSIYAIIFERPQRSKVIRETTRVTDCKRTISKPGKRDRVYDNKTESYVIRRILKDTKAAKEYISKMVTEGKPNREYTLEEWNRAGHYRRKPGSEEKVWIEPTTCHRRLELSDKEIHIKL